MFEHNRVIHFEKFMKRMIKELTLLSLQFGIQTNDVETVLKRIIAECKDGPLERKSIIRKAIEVLESFHSTEKLLPDQVSKKLFQYEEDEQLHSAICSLKKEVRIPFILFTFHEFTSLEIAELLNQSAEEVNQSIPHAERDLLRMIPMQKEQYLQSLSFLKKSYNRIPEISNDQRLFSEEQLYDEVHSKEDENKEEKKKSIVRNQLIGYVLAALFFFSLIIFSSISNERIDDQYVEELEKEFELKVEERRTTLQMNKVVFGQAPFVVNAKSLFRVFQNEMNQSLDSDKPFKRKVAKRKFEDVLDSFQLPSEMIREIEAHPLTDDENASYDFLETYMNRLSQTRDAYYPEYNPDRQEPTPIVEAMNAQGLVVGGNGIYRYIAYDRSSVKELQKYLHPSLKPYIEMVAVEEMLFSRDSITPEELLKPIPIVEEIILNDQRRAGLYSTAKLYYEQLFSTLTYAPSIYNKDLTIKEEYRKAWQTLAVNQDTSPIGAIFATILSELEAGEWIYSKTLRSLDIHLDLDRAITFAQQEKLADYHEVERYRMDKYPYSAIDLPNEELYEDSMRLVEKIQLNGDFNQSVSITGDPLLLVGAYDRAQKNGDLKIIWKLTPYKYFPFDYVKENVNIGMPILEGVERIEFDPEWNHTNGFAPILFTKDGNQEIGVWIAMHGNEWLVEKVIDAESGS